jgi:2-methylcitrate dehydratase PrpD
MGQNEEQILNAIGIAFMQISGSMIAVMDYTHSSKLLQGVAGWNGILSAELAQRGFSGPREPLMGQFGYYQQFSRGVDTEIITRDLGKKFYADEEFKLYPCCRGNASSVETTLKLVSENDIEPSQIKEIYIELNPFWKGSFLIQPFKIGPCTQVSAILNLNYNVSSALLRKSSRLENYTDEAIRDPAVQELANKIKISTDSTGKRMSCLIRVVTLDNREYSASIDVPRGDYTSNPITKGEIIEKFKTSAAFSRAITGDNAKRAIDMLERLEELKDLTGLINVLIPK